MSNRLKRSIASVMGAVIVATASYAVRAGTIVETEVIDLAKTSIRGLPPSLKVTIYRDATLAEKRPLIVLVPRFGAYLSDSPYRRQAEYFAGAGYVAAIPHLDIYNDGVHVPVYDARLEPDLTEDTTPYAIEVLALVATLSQPSGPASSQHVVVGEGFGSIVAARYGALGPPGCKGLIMISPGFSETNSFSSVRASEEAFKRLAVKVTVPSLWVYARGNKRIRESTAKDLFAAFKSGSSMAKLEILPEIGIDGDALFSQADAQTTWGEPVSRFLGSLDLH